MMDNGQPGPKRPRLEAQGPAAYSRELPPPPHNASAPHYPQHGLPYARQHEPQANPLDAHRRHSAHTEHQQYDQELRRPNSGPSAHVYHHPGPQPPQQPPYGGRPQEAMMKREPVEDVPPLGYRPASTGSATDHNVTPTHAEGRYQQPPPQHLPPFDVARHSGPPSYPAGPSYAPPQSPMPTNEYGHSGYVNQGLPPRQDQYSVTYPAASTSTQKRKAQRAAQACDSCRTLKAKCDEGRPACSSCREKQIACVYRDPPPKQQDRTTAEIIDVMKGSLEAMTEVIMQTLQNDRKATDARFDRIERHILPNSVIAQDALKTEHDEDKTSEHSQSVQESLNVAAPAPAPAVQLAPTTEGTHSQHPLVDESHFLPDESAQHAEGMHVDVVEPVTEDEEGPPVNPGQSSIPVNHTTGAARLLLIPPISKLAAGIIKSDKIKNEKYPMLQEERRGLLRLYGRGEGIERLPGYDRDHLTDHEGTSAHTPSDTSSDYGSPGEAWGQLGGLTPPRDPIQRGSISAEGMPDLSPDLVRDLVESYTTHITILHPILGPKKLTPLVEHFLKTIPDNLKPKPVAQLAPAAGFIQPRNIDSPTNKRKRSPDAVDNYDLPNIQDYKPGHPFRSIGTAIIMLVMALGAICKETGRIPDCIPDPNDTAWSSPTIRNGHPSSPSQNSPSLSTLSGLPSPVDGDRTTPRSRRTSIEGAFAQKSTTGVKPKNLDRIPGLSYFAFATDIIGNQAGGNSLQHAHANILASLYHGQLGRPLESHAYLHAASRTLQVILRPRLDRFKRTQGPVPARDNPLIFAFWTCLQLESDIVAELPVPRSGILNYEDHVPGPNLQAAADIDGFPLTVIESYSAQLYLRKHLNLLHNMFYKPENDSEVPSGYSNKKPPHFRTIDACLESLAEMPKYAPNMRWNEDDPPANDILHARLRAKYYGAKVITYRPFLLQMLEYSYAQSHPGNPAPAREPTQSKGDTPEKFPEPEVFSEHYKLGVEGVHTDIDDPKTYQYACECVNALIKSTTAFHGLGDPGKKRLFVTNIWGTAHAQFGNLLVLQAVSEDPKLRTLIDQRYLKELFDKTVTFLKFSSHPSSALTIDYKILEHVGREIGLLPKPGPTSSSFSSTSGADVPMTGH